MFRRSLLRARPRALPQQTRQITILSIETSCDDTSVALISSPTPTTASILFHETITSPNRQYGGIHPMISLTWHRANLAPILQRCLAAHPTPPDLVAASRGPGMVSSLAVGLDTAKGLAVAWGVPFLGVHHMQAHALTPRMCAALEGEEGPRFPFLTFLVSGGHTMLLLSEGLTSHKILAETMDVAVGDMVDKCARLVVPAEVLGSEGPAVAYGAVLERFAFPRDELDWRYNALKTDGRRAEEAEKVGRWGNWNLGVPLTHNPKSHFKESFSFCGLGSAVERYVERFAETITVEERRALGREVLMVAFEHLTSRVVIALNEIPVEDRANVKSLVVSGGVASNRFLRHLMKEYLINAGFPQIELVTPPPKFCTDNAAMIGWAGIEMYREGWATELSVGPIRKWSLDERKVDQDGVKGGVLGVDGWKEIHVNGSEESR